MKICVSAVTNNLDSQVDPRFGRCPYFIIVDTETMQFEAIPNVAFGAMGGAGIQAAQTIASKGAKVLITGNVGPNAFQALSTAGIKIVTGAYGTTLFRHVYQSLLCSALAIQKIIQPVFDWDFNSFRERCH